MNIPLPEGDDIYALGYDRDLARGIPDVPSNVVYNSIEDQTPAQVITLGGLAAGAANTFVAMDPTKGLWLGSSIFETAPFRVNMAGELNATSGKFTGDITGASGTFTGTVTVGLINIPDQTSANSFHVAGGTTYGGDTWWGSNVANGTISAKAYVLNTGAAAFSNITVTGTINATAGYTGSNTALVYESTGMNAGITGHLRGGATDYLTGTGFFIGYTGAAYKFSVGNPAGNYIGWDGTTLTIIGNQVDVQTFTADGTWTKPTGAKSVMVEVWGGGAGGRSSGGGTAAGGGGGMYQVSSFNAATLGTTEAVTVGALAAAGVAGNFSTFGTWMKAFGGGTSTGGGGGGGGGIFGSGAVGGGDGGNGGGPLGGTGGNAAAGGDNSGYGGGGGGDSDGGAGPYSGGGSVYGGGGGGGGGGAGQSAGDGGLSIFGGGGGGGASNLTAASGGTSKTSGAGGAGATSGTATAGTAPSGGGGGAYNGTGGAGARGQVRVTSYL